MQGRKGDGKEECKRPALIYVMECTKEGERGEEEGEAAAALFSFSPLSRLLLVFNSQSGIETHSLTLTRSNQNKSTILIHGGHDSCPLWSFLVVIKKISKYFQ